MDGAANGELEAGSDDVIVSADDTGLVTVTYNQPDDDSGKEHWVTGFQTEHVGF